MDIAIVIDRLVPAAQYSGSVNCGTEAGYDALTWVDERTKPAWSAILTEWDVVQGEMAAAAALEECYVLRRAAYIAAGWVDEWDLIDDILDRGASAVKADRDTIKALYPKP